MKLQSRKKMAHDRCVDPAQTIARLEAIIRPRYDYWLHEEIVSDELHWSAMFIEGLEFRSMGKGVTAESSRAGALAEGAEWLLARATEELPGYMVASEEAVCEAVSFASLLGHVASATPPVLDRIRALEEACHWVNGYSLIHERTVKVPLEYVRLISGPNGKATGNNIEEAILHAGLEVLERRAQIAVLRNRMVVPTIDAATVSEPWVQRQIEFLRGHGIEVVLKDLSFGGVLPCIGAYFLDHNIPEGYQFRHFFKIGTSFDTREALLRMFTEYAQGRSKHEFLIPGSKDLESQIETLLAYDFRKLPSQPEDCDNFMSSFMFGFVPYRNADFFKEGEIVPMVYGELREDCLEDIQEVCAICDTLGKDCIVVDLSDPDAGFPVVQVVVPGYSDVLPFHPADSSGLFRRWTRTEVLESYQQFEF
ncbi:MAG: Ribosomal protein S12 methylthiotransferase accessory factor YcaO [Verrucomicrobia bacterium]|nr:MAG: Ribosomal protein S12 methylthiotransferase accessory factor YcaO [Verrucomicrobiota bacterium]